MNVLKWGQSIDNRFDINSGQLYHIIYHHVAKGFWLKSEIQFKSQSNDKLTKLTMIDIILFKLTITDIILIVSLLTVSSKDYPAPFKAASGTL